MSRHRPRKRFGQHFLVDAGVIEATVRAIAPAPSDTIVEIGPGQGALTEALAPAVGHLHLVELDRDLAARQRERWQTDARVTVHEADALDFDFAALGNELRIVGNLPYNISTPLLFHLLEQRENIRDMHFMLQKEVVDRIAAPPGGKTYGRLSVMLQAHLVAESLFEVPPEAFAPPPAVTSAVLRLYALPGSVERPADDALLGEILKRAFGQRRKTLRNSLSGTVTVSDLEASGIDPGVRAEAVPVEAWLRLVSSIAHAS
jgi:16S rRNA (adenine1518-N6/adenine1519-N6)-dimethyltransferase